MLRQVLKAIAPAALALVISAPASAQVRIDLGSVHIRIADSAPPRVHRERRSVRPSRAHVWIKGYYDRQDDRWVWVSGRWERPHVRNARWIRPRYVREGRYWRYEPARWSYQRVEEGDDYRHWRERNRRDRNRGRDGYRDRDRDRDRDGDHDHDRDRDRDRERHDRY